MKKISTLFILLTATLFVACSKDDDTRPDEVSEKFLIAEKKSPSGLDLKLWADTKDLSVAWNKLYLSIKNAAGADVTTAPVTFIPLMDMPGMKHSSPVEQPVYNNKEGLYEGAAVFSMPSGEMGSWTLTATVNGEPVVFDIAVRAAQPNTKNTGTYVGTDGQNYSVSLVEPLAPRTGLNELNILINKREDMMHFPPADDLTIEVNPEMPSMGHGSPNNINPVHESKGHYRGKVNFTMTGDWRLHFRLKRGNAVIVEDATIDLLF